MQRQQIKNKKHTNVAWAITLSQVLVLSDFVFKWPWLRDLILSVQTLSPLSNMFYNETLRGIRQPKHNHPFKAFHFRNQQQSNGTIKWKKRLCAHSSSFEVNAVWALLYCVRSTLCVCVCTWSTVLLFLFMCTIYVILPGVRQEKQCSLAACLSA